MSARDLVGEAPEPLGASTVPLPILTMTDPHAPVPRAPAPFVTAVHEAGHAVTAVVLRLGLVDVTIVPTDEYLGLCRTSDRTRQREALPDDQASWSARVAHERRGARRAAADRARARRRCVCTLAGPLAQMRVDPSATWGDETADHDRKAVVNSVHQASDGAYDDDAFVEDMKRDASALLDRTWPAVLAVADALLVTGTLSARAVRDVVRAHLPLGGGAF